MLFEVEKPASLDDKLAGLTGIKSFFSENDYGLGSRTDQSDLVQDFSWSWSSPTLKKSLSWSGLVWDFQIFLDPGLVRNFNNFVVLAQFGPRSPNFLGPSLVQDLNNFLVRNFSNFVGPLTVGFCPWIPGLISNSEIPILSHIIIIS